MAHRGHPILGDRDYGPRDDQDGAFRRLAGKAIFLHAGALRFNHPVDGRQLSVELPLPEELAEALTEMGLICPARWRP
jgi:23S rRNA pseudouridine955/2504/2580 synthase